MRKISFEAEPDEINGIVKEEDTEKKETYWYLFAAFVIPLVMLYFIYIGMEVWPFGRNSVLVLDLNGQYVYYFEAFRKVIWEGGNLLYSWTRSLGGEFLGIFAYYLCSPFTLIVALFPAAWMTEALLTLILIKTGMCGMTMAFYLRTSRKTSHFTAILFGLMYALCSYGVIQTMDTMWIDAMYLMPILLLGLERLTEKGKPALYCLILAFLFLTNYYIGFMTALFMIICFFWCTFGRNRVTFGNFMKSGLRFALYSLLAAAIAAILLLPAYYGLTFGKMDFQQTDYSFFQRFDFLDFFAKLMPASYDTVRPEGIPTVYSGMLTLIFTPLYFVSPGIRPKQKAWSGVVCVILVMCMNMSTVDIFWHGMSKPNWLNYRYSFMFCFFIIAMAAEAFSHFEADLPARKEALSVPRIAFSRVLTVALALFIIIMMIQKQEYEHIDDMKTIWFALGALGAYLIVLNAISKGTRQSLTRTFLLLMCCAELFGSGLCDMVALDQDVVFSDRQPYANFMARFRPVVDKVNSLDDDLFRVEKTVHRKVNDNMALNIRGISHSTSDLNAASIKFLAQLGYASRSHWSKYLGGTPVADSLLGIQYIISEDDQSDLYNLVLVGDEEPADPREVYFAPADEDDEDAPATKMLFTFENPYAPGVLYTVSEAVQNLDMEEYDTPFERMNAIVTAMLDEKKTVELFKPIDLDSTDYINCDYGFTTGHRKYSPENDSRDASLIYTLEAPTDDEVFIFFPSNWAREVKLELNGEDHGTYFGNETRRIVSLGSFDAGTPIELRMTLKEDTLYIATGVDYFWYLDEELFAEIMPRLTANRMSVSEWDDTYIRGIVTTDQTFTRLFTSIPYDEGWKVKVDNKEVFVNKTFDSMLSVDLTSFGDGEHLIEMHYMPDIYVWGFYISMGGIGLFILCILLNRLFRNLNAHDEELASESVSGDTSCLPLSELLAEVEAERRDRSLYGTPGDPPADDPQNRPMNEKESDEYLKKLFPELPDDEPETDEIPEEVQPVPAAEEPETAAPDEAVSADEEEIRILIGDEVIDRFFADNPDEKAKSNEKSSGENGEI